MPISFVLPRFQAMDANGAPLFGGKLYTYRNRTEIPCATYADYEGKTVHTHPIILDARGEAVIYLTSGAVYTFRLQNAAGKAIWTEDYVEGVVSSSRQIKVGKGLTGGGVLKDDIQIALAVPGTLNGLTKNDVQPHSHTHGLSAATETLAGVAAIATQDETKTGTIDSKIVTPKKLNKGFADLMRANKAVLKELLLDKDFLKELFKNGKDLLDVMFNMDSAGFNPKGKYEELPVNGSGKNETHYIWFAKLFNMCTKDSPHIAWVNDVEVVHLGTPWYSCYEAGSFLIPPGATWKTQASNYQGRGVVFR